MSCRIMRGDYDIAYTVFPEGDKDDDEEEEELEVDSISMAWLAGKRILLGVAAAVPIVWAIVYIVLYIRFGE